MYWKRGRSLRGGYASLACEIKTICMAACTTAK